METKVKANLFIPGVGKSGTSSLHLYLNQHPKISMSEIKEPQFFSMEEQYKKGFEYYNSLFADKEGATYYGESTTSYIASEIAMERIKKFANEPKFIIVLRNPIDRIYSHYTWLMSLGKKSLPFKEEIIEDMDSVFDPNNPIQGMGFMHYYFFSKYGTMIERYFGLFGKKNIHIITTEKLKQYPLETLNGCFDFLGVSRMAHLNKKEENVTDIVRIVRVDRTPKVIRRVVPHIPDWLKNIFGVKRIFKSIFIHSYRYKPMSSEDRKWLRDLLNNEVQKLKKITGYQFPEWVDFV